MNGISILPSERVLIYFEQILELGTVGNPTTRHSVDIILFYLIEPRNF